MSANYRLTPNPNPKGDGQKQPLHARLVANGTVGIEELMKYGKERSTFSTADMKGAMQLISDLMADYLMMGYNVELEGIGFFGLSLQSRPVMDKTELRSESVHFKNINFRCSKEMKRRLKSMPLSRLKETTVKEFSAQEREQRLMDYLSNNAYISRVDYMAINHCCKNSALNDLKRFIAEGKLLRAGHRNTSIYLKVAKNDSPE